MDHDGWKGILRIRRFTNFRDANVNAPTKLGNYYRDGKRYDVNGYFEQNGQRMIFTIAANSDRATPGVLSGQRFEVELFSWDKDQAAGKTFWNEIPFGVILSRGNIPSVYGNNFTMNKWIGTWNMNHDGWRGTLRITGFYDMPITHQKMVNATYTDQNGAVKTVTGALDMAHPHHLLMNINFAADNNQPFELLFHTWTEKTFSGVTQWGGMNFGVEAFKQ
jgi:hypothetical protein